MDKLKKVVFNILLIIISITLISCNKTNNMDNKDNSDNEIYDLGGIDFNIMANVANRIDPRHPEYERLFREEKIQNIKDVEEKYNVNVNYLDYPSNASWGVPRENWIIEQSTLGSTNAHVFEINSGQMAMLAVNDAILPLDDLIEKYGSESFWNEKKAYGKVFDKVYTYDDNYPLAEEGIYYNSDLIAELLGEERRIEPTELWKKGEWTWEKFKDLAEELNSILDHERAEEDGGAQYVLGGRTYDWLYPLLGSNGTKLVNSNFEANLLDTNVMDTVEFLNSLYEQPGMWIDDADLGNTTQPEFTRENVVFHAGESWFLIVDNRWSDLKFGLDFVPFPVGPNINDDKTNYFMNDVKGESSFVISSAFSKDRIPEGYENFYIHDEIIFKIWNDLLYFPKYDENIKGGNLEDIKDDFYITRLLPFYASEESREAHLDIFELSSPDYFYSIEESDNHVSGSYMLELEKTIRHGDIRKNLETLQNELQSKLNERIHKNNKENKK